MLSFFDNKQSSLRSAMASIRASRAIGIAFVLLTLALAISVAFSLFLILNVSVGALRDGHLLVGSTVPVRLEFAAERLRLPTGLQHDGWVTTTVQLEQPGVAQELLSTAMLLVQLTLLVAVLWLLRAIVRSVRLGVPFGLGSVTRLRAIAAVLIIGGPLAEAVDEALRTALFDRLSEAQQAGVGTAGYTIPGNLILAGLGALVLAEVFAHGLSLQEDVEATI
jgi:Protein of unknown function (DUF2975)